MDSEEKNNIGNKYIILNERPIGDGNFSKGYLVEDKNTKMQYAAKVLNERDDSFDKEVSIHQKVSSLNNPYIIKYEDSGEGLVKIDTNNDNKQCLIMEHASKGILFDYIYHSQICLKEIQAKLIFKKILLGVKAIHEANFCHLDLKIENILIDESYNPKIGDFGLAETIDEISKCCGTESYMTPEIIYNFNYYRFKADIFSLGVILFFLFTSKKPFKLASHKDPDFCYIIIKNKNLYWDNIIMKYQ